MCLAVVSLINACLWLQCKDLVQHIDGVNAPDLVTACLLRLLRVTNMGGKAGKPIKMPRMHG